MSIGKTGCIFMVYVRVKYVFSWVCEFRWRVCGVGRVCEFESWVCEFASGVCEFRWRVCECRQGVRV